MILSQIFHYDKQLVAYRCCHVSLVLPFRNNYRIYRYLKDAGQSITKTVIAAVNGYLQALNEEEKEERFINRMTEVIQENLKALIPLMNLLRITQPISAPLQQPVEEESSLSEEVRLEQMQDFLNSFGGDDPDPEEGPE